MMPLEQRSRETAAQADPRLLEAVPPGLTAVQLGAEPVRLRFARPEVAGEARPLLRLVNARDCRRAALIRVGFRGRQVGSLEAFVPAQWASFLLDLSETLGHHPEAWPRVLELEIRAQETPAGLRDSLQPGPLPAVLVGGEARWVPTSAWVGVPLGVGGAERTLGDFLHGRAADYLGWMIGCTTTGLADLHRATAGGEYLDSLKRALGGSGEGLPLEGVGAGADGGGPDLPYVDGLNQRLESFAPAAALAYLQGLEPTPQRAALLRDLGDRMVETARAGRDFLTTEGCFTLAFPLAAGATALGEPVWWEVAWRECARRWDFLWRDGRVIQRAYLDGRTHMTDWARGTAWLVLGTAQTALQLPPDHPGRLDLASRIAALAPSLLGCQRPGGLWGVFTDQPGLPVETSGAAGIAAALALGAGAGWLGPQARQAAERCAHALEAHLEPDGCLGGVSQHNPASEVALQQTYRIRAAWGTGLYAQLIAALRRHP